MLKSSKKIFFFKFLIYVNFMLIYVNITDGQTDRQTHQKYSSEPHKIILFLKEMSFFSINVIVDVLYIKRVISI